MKRVCVDYRQPITIRVIFNKITLYDSLIILVCEPDVDRTGVVVITHDYNVCLRIQVGALENPVWE